MNSLIHNPSTTASLKNRQGKKKKKEKSRSRVFPGCENFFSCYICEHFTRQCLQFDFLQPVFDWSLRDIWGCIFGDISKLVISSF